MIKVPKNVLPTLSPELRPPVFVADQIFNCSHQCLKVFEWHEHACFIPFDNFPAAAYIGGDYRQPHRSCLHACSWHPLSVGRKDKKVHACVPPCQVIAPIEEKYRTRSDQCFDF